MSELSSTLQFDSSRWGDILAILSLDAAAPFLKDMGLNVTIDDRFRMGLRKIIEGYLRANPLDSEEANEWGIEEARTLGMPLESLGKLGDWASLPK